jgi:hypothetical protein
MIPRDGHQLREDWWVRDEQTVRAQAVFDLKCPAESLQLSVLKVFDSAFADRVSVTGCDRRAASLRETKRFDSLWIRDQTP